MSQKRKAPWERTFEELEQALVDEQNTLPSWVWFRLSGIDGGEEEERLRALWPRIPLQRRRALLEELENLLEEDYTLSYFAVARAALEDPDARVRAMGIRLLWDEEKPEFAERFLQLLENDPDDEVRATAAGALGQFVYMGMLEELAQPLFDRIVATLLRIYHNTTLNAAIRRRALEAVSYAMHPEVPAAIQAAYEQEDEEWKASALFAMGRHGEQQRWGAIVLRHLKDKSPRLRAEAAQAAGELQLRKAVEPLLQLLHDTEASVRMAAAWALSEIGQGGQRVERALQQALQRAKDEDEASLYQDALDNFAFNAGANRALMLMEVEEDKLADLDEDELFDELLGLFEPSEDLDD